MRLGRDVYKGGRLWDGYDYKLGAWVKKGKFVRCGHHISMCCNCYGRLHEGEDTKVEEGSSRLGKGIAWQNWI